MPFAVGGAVPLRSATLLDCVPLDGSRLGPRDETLSIQASELSWFKDLHQMTELFGGDLCDSAEIL